MLILRYIYYLVKVNKFKQIPSKFFNFVFEFII